jgi:hypothetical protein
MCQSVKFEIEILHKHLSDKKRNEYCTAK